MLVNRTHLMYKINIMQAHLEGETIETKVKDRGQSNWRKIKNDPAWDWFHYDYRVLPNVDRQADKYYDDVELTHQLNLDKIVKDAYKAGYKAHEISY
jgi:hypothetical protein